MTKKHFDQIARFTAYAIFAAHDSGCDIREELIRRAVELCGGFSPRFDEARFRIAVESYLGVYYL